MEAAERKTFLSSMKGMLLLYVGMILVYFGTDPIPALAVLDVPIRVFGTAVVLYSCWASLKRLRRRRENRRVP